MKQRYRFYYMKDSNRETLGIANCESLTEAIKTFALIKNLPMATFLTIFNVELYESRGTK